MKREGRRDDEGRDRTANRRDPDEERDARRRRAPERLGDLLPDAARRLGLEEQLAEAQAAAAWHRIVEERVPAAAGSCRLASSERGVGLVVADESIVAQELRLRSTELAAAMRAATDGVVSELRIVVRHV